MIVRSPYYGKYIPRSIVPCRADHAYFIIVWNVQQMINLFQGWVMSGSICRTHPPSSRRDSKFRPHWRPWRTMDYAWYFDIYKLLTMLALHHVDFSRLLYIFNMQLWLVTITESNTVRGSHHLPDQCLREHMGSTGNLICNSF